jgi:hypothetical protein
MKTYIPQSRKEVFPSNMWHNKDTIWDSRSVKK